MYDHSQAGLSFHLTFLSQNTDFFPPGTPPPPAAFFLPAPEFGQTASLPLDNHEPLRESGR